MRRIYLDYAASTPLLDDVAHEMAVYFKNRYGNPGSLHSFGQEAMAAVDKSREIVAKAIGADFREIIFTASATEANNLLLRGVAGKIAQEYKNPTIITSVIEHESILDTASDLKGVKVSYVEVGRSGVIDATRIKEMLGPEVVLVSIMYVNNEIGTVQPIKTIARIIKEYRETNNSRYPFFHTDASQAFQFLDCDVNELGIDFMTLSSHKMYGPKGAGALYIRNLDMDNPPIQAMLRGGGQEFGLRSSTENVPALVGFAKAIQIMLTGRVTRSKNIKGLRDHLLSGIKNNIPGAELNGDLKARIPNNLNVYMPGIRAEDALIKLDLAGIAASSGSACKSRSLAPSYVIEALGFDRERALSSLRFSLGIWTTQEEIDIVLRELIKLIKNHEQ